jgi:membrane-bound metal-dependent hydrolase YbcI (DUF457 family)
MFIGHFAVGFAGKKIAPRAPLAGLLLAALFADVLWPVLVAVGAEHVRIVPGDTVYTPLEFVSYPWSHSLLMLIIWGGFFAAYYRARPDGRRIGLVLGALVVSHWVLDWITHRADMPLWPRGPKYGLALWNNPGATMAVELAMFAVGVFLYAKSTRARDKIGTFAFWGFVVFLGGFYVMDSLSGSPPPSVRVIWISALIATAVVLLWASWFDSHRVAADQASLK